MTKTPAPIVVEINISGLTLEGDDANRETGLGTITIDHDADMAYPGQATRSGDQQRVWIDGESSALDESETVSDNNLVEHTTISGKYGLPTGGEIHYDNNGVIRLVIIDPGGDGNWMDNKFHHGHRVGHARHISQPGQLQGHGGGYQCAADR